MIFGYRSLSSFRNGVVRLNGRFTVVSYSPFCTHFQSSEKYDLAKCKQTVVNQQDISPLLNNLSKVFNSNDRLDVIERVQSLNPEQVNAIMNFYVNHNQPDMINSLIDTIPSCKLRFNTLTRVTMLFCEQKDSQYLSNFMSWLSLDGKPYFPVRIINEVIKNHIEEGKSAESNRILHFFYKKGIEFSSESLNILIKYYIKHNMVFDAFNTITSFSNLPEKVLKPASNQLLSYCVRTSVTHKKHRDNTINFATNLVKLVPHPDIYTLAMRAHHINGDTESVLEYFSIISARHVLSPLHYELLLTSLARAERIDETKSYFEDYQQEFVVNPQLCGKLIGIFTKNNHIRAALYYLQICPYVNIEYYHSILSILKSEEDFDIIQILLKCMEKTGTNMSDKTLSILTKAYVQIGKISIARSLLNRAAESNQHIDEVAVNSLVKAYIEDKNNLPMAMELIGEMEERYGVKPNSKIISIVLKPLVDAGEMKAALKLFTLANSTGEINSKAYNIILEGFFAEKNFRMISKINQAVKKNNNILSRSSYIVLIRNYYLNDLIPEATEYMCEMIAEKKIPTTPQEEQLLELFYQEGLCKKIIDDLS